MIATATATETIFANTDWTMLMKNVIASVFSGFALSFAIVSYCLHFGYTYGGHRKPTALNTTAEDTTTDSNDESDEREDTVRRAVIQAYQNGFYDELDAMATDDQDLCLQEIGSRTLHESTPEGDIVMGYDVHAEAFVYYSDCFLKVAYATLDAVARKFAVQNNCKRLCVHARNELAMAKEKIMKQNEETPAEAAAAAAPPSVFAKFKKYNQVVAKTISNLIAVPEHSNRFIYKGNLLAAKIKEFDMKEEEEEEKIMSNSNDDNLPPPPLYTAPAPAVLTEMDYATYKRLFMVVQ